MCPPNCSALSPFWARAGAHRLLYPVRTGRQARSQHRLSCKSQKAMALLQCEVRSLNLADLPRSCPASPHAPARSLAQLSPAQPQNPKELSTHHHHTLTQYLDQYLDHPRSLVASVGICVCASASAFSWRRAPLVINSPPSLHPVLFFLVARPPPLRLPRISAASPQSFHPLCLFPLGNPQLLACSTHTPPPGWQTRFGAHFALCDTLQFAHSVCFFPHVNGDLPSILPADGTTDAAFPSLAMAEVSSTRLYLGNLPRAGPDHHLLLAVLCWRRLERNPH